MYDEPSTRKTWPPGWMCVDGAGADCAAGALGMDRMWSVSPAMATAGENLRLSRWLQGHPFAQCQPEQRWPLEQEPRKGPAGAPEYRECTQHAGSRHDR